MESGRPKGTIGINRELRDCLRAKALLAYGNGSSIVGLRPKGARMYSCGKVRKESGVRLNSELNSETLKLPNKFIKLVKVCERKPKNFKASDIFDLMFNIRMYEVAYHKLKSKPGNMTPGINPTTLDGISIDTFESIIAAIKSGKFDFYPGRRVHIPKGNGKTRPLTIAPPRDKIVQEVMRMILEAIFEPTFSPNSHGFRPNRSCHSALKQVKTQFGVASFFIEGDISKCFDSFNHNKLIELVRERINDERFIQLLWKALKAGYFEFHQVQRSLVGTPQGSIISPILANIYLNHLDKFVEEIKGEFDRGKTVQRNPVYRKYEYLRNKALKVGVLRNSVSANLHLKNMLSVKARLPNDPNFRRLYYVRYADD